MRGESRIRPVKPLGELGQDKLGLDPVGWRTNKRHFQDKQITGLSRAARCIQVPGGKDVNEFYMIAGQTAVTNWIKESLE